MDVVTVRLTISIFVLHGHSLVGYREVGRWRLTNREKASLNSETCSSVSESAYQWEPVSIVLSSGLAEASKRGVR